MGTKSYYTSTKIGLGGCVVGILLSFVLAPFRFLFLMAKLAFNALLKLLRGKTSRNQIDDVN